MSTYPSLKESEATLLKTKTRDDEIKNLKYQFGKHDRQKKLEMILKIIRNVKVRIKRKCY